MTTLRLNGSLDFDFTVVFTVYGNVLFVYNFFLSFAFSAYRKYCYFFFLIMYTNNYFLELHVVVSIL